MNDNNDEEQIKKHTQKKKEKLFRYKSILIEISKKRERFIERLISD